MKKPANVKINRLIVQFAKCQKLSNKSPNPKDFYFIMINDKKKQQILTLNNLEPINLIDYWMNRLIMGTLVISVIFNYKILQY